MRDTATKVPKLLNTQEAASVFNVRVETFRRLCAQGDGPPFVVVGTRKRFPEDELRAWVRDHLVRGEVAS
jgi:excisionase family DNA binding protein